MLLIMSWNCNSIKAKQQELYSIINTLKPNIIFLNESRLKPNDKFKFKNYYTERQDRLNNIGGGVACLIHRSLNYKRINNLQSNIEYITLELSSYLCITGGYAPPRAITSANDIEVFFPLNTRAILIGDLNAKHTTWINHRNNTAGIILFNHLLNNLNLQIHHPDQPTHYPNTRDARPSTIDIALTKGLNDVQLHTKTILCSDHLPIFLECNNNNFPAQAQQRIYSYKNMNWTAFRQKLNDITTIPEPITNTAELENQVKILTENIQKTRDKFARKIEIKQKIDTRHHK